MNENGNVIIVTYNKSIWCHIVTRLKAYTCKKSNIVSNGTLIYHQHD